MSELIYKKDFKIKECDFVPSDDGKQNAVIEVDGERARNRVSCLVMKGTKVFLAKDKDGSFTICGGGLEPNKTAIQQAEAEVNEESLFSIKNIKETGICFLEKSKHVQSWVKEHVANPADRWKDYYTTLYIAEYAGKYTKHVDKIDLEEKYTKGKFYEYEDVKDEPTFIQPWKDAIEAWLADHKKTLTEQVDTKKELYLIPECPAKIIRCPLGQNLTDLNGKSRDYYDYDGVEHVGLFKGEHLDSRKIIEANKILESVQEEKIILLSDVHVNNEDELEQAIDSAKQLATEDTILLILGDIGRYNNLNPIDTSRYLEIPHKKAFLVLGNHDTKKINEYYAEGFDCVALQLETSKYLFSHKPEKTNKINIHGHWHHMGVTINVNPSKHIDIGYLDASKWPNNSYRSAITLKEALKSKEKAKEYATNPNYGFICDASFRALETIHRFPEYSQMKFSERDGKNHGKEYLDMLLNRNIKEEYDIVEYMNALSNITFTQKFNESYIKAIQNDTSILDSLKKIFLNKGWKYGFTLNGNQIRFDSMPKDKYWELAESEYVIQEPRAVEKTKLGICFDIVNLERKILDKQHIQYKSIWIYREGDPSKGHNLILINLGEKYYYLELTPGTSKDYYGQTREYESYDSFVKEKNSEGFKTADITDLQLIGRKPEYVFDLISNKALNETYVMKYGDYDKEFKAIDKLIKNAKNIYLTAHISPDPDAIGSLVSMKVAIKAKYKKEPIIAKDGMAPVELTKNDLVIMFDVGELKRTALTWHGDPIVARIDHHLTGYKANVTIEDPEAGSTCGLVTLFLSEMNYPITKLMGEILFKGIIADTGRIQYSLSKITIMSLGILSDLGVDYKSIYNDMYMRTPSAVKAKSYLLNHYLTSTNGVAYLYVSPNIARSNNFDMEGLVQIPHELESIQGSLIWLIAAQRNDKITCRVRSRYIDLRPIASKYNGGGHPNAVGIKVKNKYELGLLIDDLDKILGEFKMKNPLLEDHMSLEEEFELHSKNMRALTEEAEAPVEEQPVDEQPVEESEVQPEEEQQEAQPNDVDIIAAIQDDYMNQMKQLTKAYKAQMKDVLSQAQSNVAAREEELQAIVQNYEDEIANMQADFEGQSNEMQDQLAQAQQDNEQLQSSVEELQQGLDSETYPYFNPIEGEEPCAQKSRNYIETHRANVQTAFDWIQQNCSEILNNCDVDRLAADIAEHDMSKYSEEEFMPYARYFYKDKTNAVYKREFDLAWNHHQKTNNHHWEYWLLREDDRTRPLDMTPEAIVHEICDWMSFGVAKNNMLELGVYYQKNKDTMLMSPATRKTLEEMITLVLQRVNELEGAVIDEEDPNGR